MTSEIRTNDKKEQKDDPCDSIDVTDLGGWTKYDSIRVRSQDSRQRLERDLGDPYRNSWTRFDHG